MVKLSTILSPLIATRLPEILHSQPRHPTSCMTRSHAGSRVDSVQLTFTPFCWDCTSLCWNWCRCNRSGATARIHSAQWLKLRSPHIRRMSRRKHKSAAIHRIWWRDIQCVCHWPPVVLVTTVIRRVGFTRWNSIMGCWLCLTVPKVGGGAKQIRVDLRHLKMWRVGIDVSIGRQRIMVSSVGHCERRYHLRFVIVSRRFRLWGFWSFHARTLICRCRLVNWHCLLISLIIWTGSGSNTSRIGELVMCATTLWPERGQVVRVDTQGDVTNSY